MTPHTLRPGRIAGRSTGPLHPAAALEFVLKTLVTPPLAIAVSSTKLASTVVQVLSRPAGDRHLGYCVGCGGAIAASDPFLRYRGDYYHAHQCLESNPPALRQRPIRSERI